MSENVRRHSRESGSLCATGTTCPALACHFLGMDPHVRGGDERISEKCLLGSLLADGGNTAI